MATISLQLRKLRKTIKLPWKIEFVDRVIKKEEFQEKVIYIHITI